MENFLADAMTWVVIPFLVFVGMVLAFGRKPIAAALDGYAEKVKGDLAESTQLYNEAKFFLAETQSKHANSINEADNILAQARQQSQLIRANAERDMDTLMKRREQQVADRIRILEEQATNELRARTVNIALHATEELLKNRLTAEQDAALIAKQIGELGAGLKKVA